MSNLIHLASFYSPTGDESDVLNTRGDIDIQFPDTPTLVAYVSIEPLTSRELMVSQQIRADLTHKIMMPSNATVNHRFQMRWNSRIFNIGPPMLAAERDFFQTMYAAEVRG